MFALNEMAVLECAYVYVNLPLKTAPPTYPLTFNFLTLTAYLNQLWTQPIVTLQLQLQLYCTTIFWMYVYVSKFEFSSMHTIIKIQIFIFFFHLSHDLCEDMEAVICKKLVCGYQY